MMWSPIQSPVVRQICAKMTNAERAKAVSLVCIYSIWVTLTFVLPIVNVLTYQSFLSMVIAIVLITIYIVGIPYWMKRQKKFLCSTEWSREQGLTPEQIKLFAFRL